MGLIRSALRSTSGIATPEKWVEEWFAGGEATASGVHVDEETALHYGPFFAGVRVIAEDVGSLPLLVLERLKPRGKKRAVNHPLYPLLHDAPNPLMSAVTFRSTLQAHALTWPVAYAYIVRVDGVVTELWPLRPDKVTPIVDHGPGGRMRVLYRYRDPRIGIDTMLLPDEVLPIGGLGFNGISGYSLVTQARQSLGLGMATERYGAAFFGNGSRPNGVLKHPKRLSEEGRKRLAADWENLHRGLDRAQRVAILEEGLEWEAIGVPPEDAQFLETRKFSVTEMARWLRLPPHKVGDLERATFSNIEWQGIDYVTSTLRIWLVRWEQAMLQKLFTASERGRYFAEHVVDGLMRGDTKTRYDAYAIGRNWGWLSADDVREIENLNPLPDDRGTIYLIPLNMVPAPSPKELEEAKSAPPPAEVIEGEIAGDEGEEARARAERYAKALRGRGLAARKRISEQFAPQIAAADLRIAKLERAEVSSLIRRYLEPRAVQQGRTVPEFLAACDALYNGLVRDRSIKALLPVLTELAKEIAADAAADVGADDPPDLTRFSKDYTDSHVAYRIGSALGQIRKDIGLTDDVTALAEALGVRLDRWVEERPERTATWESSQMPNAAAREAYKAAGVRTLRWVTSGDTCPFCVKLDGRTVGIEEPFVAAGEQVTGLQQKLDVPRNTFHPPLHPGCDCQVVPE